MKKISTILDKLSERSLIAFVKERQYVEKMYLTNEEIPEDYCKRHIPKTACLEIIWKDIVEQGYHQLVENLQAKELKGWTNGLEMTTIGSNSNNSNTSPRVMKKRLKEELIKLGLQEFISDHHISRRLLRETLSLLGSITESNNHEELITMINSELINLGLEYILNQLSMKILTAMVKDAQLQIKSTSKKLVVRHLMAMIDSVPQSRKSSTTPKTPSPTKESKSPKNKRKPKPEDFELIFESDDSVDWDPTMNVEEQDISIAEEDDGDKDGDSESEVDEDSSDEYVDKHSRKRSREKSKRKSSKKKSKKSSRNSDDSD